MAVYLRYRSSRGTADCCIAERCPVTPQPVLAIVGMVSPTNNKESGAMSTVSYTKLQNRKSSPKMVISGSVCILECLLVDL
jgi:hypothetical protein